MEITCGKIESAQKVVIYAVEGIGKSSFAAIFPNPLFDDTEGSTKKLNVRRLHNGKPPSSWTMLMNDINDIKREPQVCDTFVIDTIDWAEPLCKSHVCSINHVESLGDIAHGNGYVRLTEEFGKLLNSLTDLIDLGINVILVAHAWPRKFELPDEMGSFDRYETKLEKRLSPLIKEWADMVLFINYKTYVVSSGKDGKGTKKAQGGNRVIYTTHHACWDAKNRNNLPEELSFDSPEDGYRQIAHCIPPRVKPATKPQTQPVKTEPVPLAQNLDELPPPSVEKPQEQKPLTTGQPPVPEPGEDLSELPRALADLMQTNRVKIAEIQKAVALKGYFPLDTPITNYPNDFINGCLIGAWEKVFEMVKQGRK